MKMACISLRTSSVCDHRTQPSFELCSQHKEFLLELADYTFVENGAAEWAAQMENNLGSLGSALSWMKTMFLNTATPEFLANVKFDLNHGDFLLGIVLLKTENLQFLTGNTHLPRNPPSLTQFILY